MRSFLKELMVFFSQALLTFNKDSNLTFHKLLLIQSILDSLMKTTGLNLNLSPECPGTNSAVTVWNTPVFHKHKSVKASSPLLKNPVGVHMLCLLVVFSFFKNNMYKQSKKNSVNGLRIVSD